MGNKKNLILLVGASGSGKTTVAHRLAELYGFKELLSYTTRKPRYDGETGHIWAAEAEYRQVKPCDMVAYTNYCGNHYWATRQQADEADVYVIDPKGVDYFKTHYKGDRKFISVYLAVDEATRASRMEARGDTAEEVQKRIENDRVDFGDISIKVEEQREYGYGGFVVLGSSTNTGEKFDYCILNTAGEYSIDLVCDTINEIAEGR